MTYLIRTMINLGYEFLSIIYIILYMAFYGKRAYNYKV